ncbi:MAG: aromatic ring-hydroxylating dioxygenase subunit alpha [Pigmentiphaga sp.]|nr:aromatic ring-hydroxylating dioxygenase subunit alpha [Pigmentiphaga sp.]
MNPQTLGSRATPATIRLPRRLADSHTPLIRNAWYVAAMSSELGEQPFSRTILERNVALYRTADGRAHALQNRCAHRSFPLSDGKVINDRLVCGYHGLEYAPSGQCVHAPSHTAEPRNIRVRSYPTREKGHFIWIWMGDPELADDSLLPLHDWMADGAWDRSFIAYHIPGSYVHLHENLLDLSHLSYLHIGSGFGTPEHAITPATTEVTGDRITVWRNVECQLPAMLGKPLGWAGHRGIRRSGTEWVSPALVTNTVELTNLEHPELNPPGKPTGKIGHFITPETRDRLHYYVTFNRNYANGDAEVTEYIRGCQQAALEEDVYALRRILEVEHADQDPHFQESDIATDKAGVAMRKRLLELAQRESDSTGSF